MSLKRYFVKYTFEIIVIVMGISISFFIEDVRQKNELKNLTKDLRNNLLSEIHQIENYLKTRLEGFDNDLKIVDFLKTTDKDIEDSLPRSHFTTLWLTMEKLDT